MLEVSEVRMLTLVAIMRVKSPHAVSPRFPVQRSSEQGESAPKARQRCVADGKQVYIPAPSLDAKGGRIAEGCPGVGCPGLCFCVGLLVFLLVFFLCVCCVVLCCVAFVF